MKILRSHLKNPPGSFQYEQIAPNGSVFKRTVSATFDDLVNKVMAFRVGNSLSRSDRLSVVVDVDEYNVQRLGVNSKWVHDTDAQPDVAFSISAPQPCAGCGARIV